MSFMVVSAASLASLVVVHGITFLIGRRIGRHNIVDVAWGIGFVAVAAVAAALGTGDFGDACVWWGLWLAGIAAWVSLLTVLSPVLMTYFLVYATGAKLTEKYIRHRPGFAEYRSRTSFSVPTLPKSRLP
jgi:steroid 5-alpha reductase family enzyme